LLYLERPIQFSARVDTPEHGYTKAIAVKPIRTLRYIQQFN
jgi:hypothetical protein